MARMPSNVAEFLSGKRFAVAGVSRQPQQAANAVFRKLRRSGFEVIRSIQMHRAFGQGSVAPEAVHECGARGIQCIVGGCPMMYCKPVDFGHRCMRWLLRFGGKVPG